MPPTLEILLMMLCDPVMILGIFVFAIAGAIMVFYRILFGEWPRKLFWEMVDQSARDLKRWVKHLRS